jgi:hypothetical protein
MTASGQKWGPEACAAIIARVEQGVPFKDAARAAGVKYETARSWLGRGRREDSGPYAEFAQAIEQARHSAVTGASMDADELAQVVSEMARKGSVQAAKLRWEMLRVADEREAAAARYLDEFDELKARRAARGG